MFQMLISSYSLAYQDSADRDCHQLLMYPWKATSARKGRDSEVVLEVSLGSFLLLFSLSLRVTREKELRSVLQNQWPMLSIDTHKGWRTILYAKPQIYSCLEQGDTAITALLSFLVVPQECTVKSNLAFRLHINSNLRATV